MLAIVTAPVCPLKSRPEGQAELSDEVLYGMAVEATQRRGSWTLVTTHYRYQGWAPARYLRTGEEAEEWETLPKTAVRTKHTCDVLCRPDFAAPILLTLPLGAVLSPVEDGEDGWERVALCGGQRGWVRTGALGPHCTVPPFDDEDRLRALIVDNALRYRGTQYR